MSLDLVDEKKRVGEVLVVCRREAVREAEARGAVAARNITWCF